MSTGKRESERQSVNKEREKEHVRKRERDR